MLYAHVFEYAGSGRKYYCGITQQLVLLSGLGLFTLVTKNYDNRTLTSLSLVNDVKVYVATNNILTGQ